MSGPYFETWTHENLVKFAKEAYEKLQRQEEELQRLRWPFPETRPATREEKIVNPGVYEVPVEQEPVAGYDKYGMITHDPSEWVTPLYTTPPRREWVGLTEEEVDECYYWKGRQWTTDELVRHVEAKLKEKNA